jgi:hypothetical protein
MQKPDRTQSVTSEEEHSTAEIGKTGPAKQLNPASVDVLRGLFFFSGIPVSRIYSPDDRKTNYDEL